ncbi:MAG: TIGR01777 family oxidoreductase [Bacteroidota bacterium]|nr:TIGR01777 family oxidoreductase [Bacteroidota bacterium]
MANFLITGGTGLVGTRLTQMLLAKGHHVIILSRRKNAVSSSGLSYAFWDPQLQQIDNDAVASADYIIHLAGAGVAEKRWTKARKLEILNSRTQSSSLLVKALRDVPNKVKAIVSSSAIGWYGPDSNSSRQNGFEENMQAEKDFLGSTCYAWEQSIQPVADLGKRLVILRTGIVLSKEGGALKEFMKPLKSGVAAILGSGRQTISWIHIDDLCRMFMYAVEQPIEGVFNAVAPHPVTNKELTLVLAKKMRRSFFVPVHVPSLFLKIILGEMSIEVLKSTTVSSQKIKNTGFTFLFPALDAALNDLLTKDHS